MRPSEIFWEIFAATGHIGIYLLYKRHQEYELKIGWHQNGAEISREEPKNSIIG
ncbi:MAG: hypothetical protein ACPLQP_07715 [Moorellaceae bacterium]